MFFLPKFFFQGWGGGAGGSKATGISWAKKTSMKILGIFLQDMLG